MKITIDRCPYCGSTEGFAMLEKVKRYLWFNFDGEPYGATDDESIYSSKAVYCVKCFKSLKKYIKVE